MTELDFSNIPLALSSLPQWVLWIEERRGGKPTKVPVSVSGQMAKSNDPETWSSFEDVQDRYLESKHAGIGFMFSETDEFCGVDLDACRNPESGEIEEWAKEIIESFGSYAEVSPSKTGVKIFCIGKNPFETGKKFPVDGKPIGGKSPAIEVYDRLRYFAVTGWRLNGPKEPLASQESLDWIKAAYGPRVPPMPPPVVDFRSDAAVLDRARKYLAKLPPSISGAGGHNVTFHAACVLVLGFALPESDAIGLLREYSSRCEPPWAEKELAHKIASANKQPGERGYLRYATPDRWGKINVPAYQEPMATPEPKTITLVDATVNYLEALQKNGSSLIELGMPDVDYAICGGVERGEMVIVAARPSHGKSAFALQSIHYWTSIGMPCVMVSEEMSALALGKRTLQFITPMPSEHWRDGADMLRAEVEQYAADRAPCLVVESCGTVENAAAAIERAVKNDGVQCAVVDYAQLLRSSGKTRYEQITNVSVALRQLASSQKIVLMVLCQLNRAIEGRNEFTPVMADLKDTGQLEQDADVIMFLVWPHRIDPSNHPGKYQVFVAKNRNRAINQNVVTCHFDPSRQTIRDQMPEPTYGGIKD